MKVQVLVPEGVKRLCRVFCQCGCEEDAWETVRNFLEYYERRHGSDEPYDAEKDPHKTGSDWIVAYLLAHLELTEHGSNVGRSWLDYGHEALAFLRKWGPDWRDNETIQFTDDDSVNYN